MPSCGISRASASQRRLIFCWPRMALAVTRPLHRPYGERDRLHHRSALCPFFHRQTTTISAYTPTYRSAASPTASLAVSSTWGCCMRTQSIFVGLDGSGKACFDAKRGTWGMFKGEVTGSDKRIAFHLPCGSEMADVYAFELPIDLMSWFTLERPICNAVPFAGCMAANWRRGRKPAHQAHCSLYGW